MATFLNQSDNNNMPSIWILLAAAGTLAYIGIIVYRLTLHPLANFPGPRLAGATHWYEAYYELAHNGGAQFAPHVRALHARYGPIVRINPDEISVDDAEFHDKLYAPQPAVRDRHPNFSSALGTTAGSFSTPGHDLHRKRRVAYSPFFATANVMATESMVREKVRRLCDLVGAGSSSSSSSSSSNNNSDSNDSNSNSGHNSGQDKKVGGSDEGSPIPLRTYFAAISFDGFYAWAFGSHLHLLDDLAAAQRCNDTVELLVTSAPFYRIFPTVMSMARRVPSSALRLLSHHVDRVFGLHGLILNAAERFVAEQQCPPDAEKAKVKPDSPPPAPQPETLFSVIRRSKSAPDAEKTASRIAQEGTEMFMASFTPGRTMMLAMYYLHANPRVLGALREELDQANPDPADDLSYKTLNGLPLLRAIMKEIYRVTFPVGSRLPMICHDVMEYKHWKIPANTSISVNHRSLLFNPKVYPEPFAFRPERWLDESKPIDERRHFVAFGKGGRGCPGKEFATQIIQLTVCTLIQRFDFELVDTSWEEDVAASRESILIAPAFASKGIKLNLVGPRSKKGKGEVGGGNM